MDLGIKNKTAIVAASSQGLGKAIAEGFAAEGVNLVMCARTDKTLRKTAEDIVAQYGVDVLTIVADLSRAADIKRIVKKAVAHFGTIHILVNNAGGPPVARFDELTDSQWEQGVQLTLMSVVRMIREVLPFMQKQHWGRIITINSVAGKQPINDLIISSSLRPGLIGLSKVLANQYGKDGILVNSICPGYMLTQRLEEITKKRAEENSLSVEKYLLQQTKDIPVGRYGDPADLASMAVFLASERARHINGTTISIDGGSIKGLL
jgi:3-oxoacyl-[acyl-carrier protein] reductase